jgi:hypothetical protein
MICSPTGRPSRVWPTVTDAAGSPVKLPSAENASQAVPGHLDRRRSCRALRPSSNAALPVVGVSRKSRSP